ncbi:MAG: hypothetical protein B0W54_06160 [Cellvibrio sp. 79]|nr:MAG: hypothetical protein B0W54_06160 [Cellvibrio sp. 79]
MFLPVFNSGVCVFDFENFNNYVGKEKTDLIVESLFNLPEVVGEKNVIDAQGGRSLSTVHLYKSHIIPELLNFKSNPLGLWILNRIAESAVMLGFDKTRNIRKLKYHRTWVNRMYRNCDAVAHRHAVMGSTIPHMVAIYYLEVPENSAELIFIDDNDFSVMRGGRYYEYAENQRYTILPKTGRLVCHDARSLHATSAHLSLLPRTCLIIEVGFPPLK